MKIIKQFNYIYIIKINDQIYNFCLMMLEYLSCKERIRYQNILRFDDKKRFLIAHIILRFLINIYLYIPLSEIIFYYNQYGKLFLLGNALYFNISHSGDYIIISISQENNGVDLEFQKHIEKLELKNILNDYFSEMEKSYIDQDITKFYEIWTIKESYLKFKGSGLIDNLKNICTFNVKAHYNVSSVFIENYCNACIFDNKKDNVYVYLE